MALFARMKRLGFYQPSVKLGHVLLAFVLSQLKVLFGSDQSEMFVLALHLIHPQEHSKISAMAQAQSCGADDSASKTLRRTWARQPARTRPSGVVTRL